MPDVVSDIKKLCPPGDHNLDTAEGRAEWDKRLRAELEKIDDPSIRAHAARMIGDWRWHVIRGQPGDPIPSREITCEEDMF